MSEIALITIEGVLAAGEDLRTAPPFRWAKPMYDALRTQWRTIALTRADHELARWWLNREMLPGWSSVHAWNTPMSYEDWRVDQVRDFLANGFDLAFLLDNDRDVTTVVQSMGVLTLSIGPPLVHPGWRPEDHHYRAWTTISDTLETQP